MQNINRNDASNAMLMIPGLHLRGGYLTLGGLTSFGASAKDEPLLIVDGVMMAGGVGPQTVPEEEGVITFQNCLFENQGIVIKSKDFPNDLENLKITNCAFTTRLNANKKKILQYFVPITLFAYATKCDLYLDIEFKPFDWAFKKPVATEWYIADERFRKMTEDSVKLNKTISMKFPSKAFTSYKQMEATPDKETKKEEK